MFSKVVRICEVHASAMGDTYLCCSEEPVSHTSDAVRNSQKTARR